METDGLSLVTITAVSEVSGYEQPQWFQTLFMLSAQSACHDAIVNQQPWPPMSPLVPSFPLPLSIIINIIFLLLLLNGARSRTVATLFSFGFSAWTHQQEIATWFC